jgi:outer membrane biosynthesis protein TonB
MPHKKKRKKTMPKPKKASKKKSSPKKKAKAKNAPPKKKPARKTRRARGRSQSVATVGFEPRGRGLGADSGGQSGDLQGLSDSAEADSESVDELLEEGNAFEAEVVEGVESAPDADRGGVRTHEVPEDDVPDEYLDKDQ